MMRRLLVKAQDGQRAYSRLWDVSRPLPLGHPVSWVLVSAENGVRVLDLRGERGKVQNNRLTFFSHEEIRRHGVERVLGAPGEGVSLSIRECSELRAAHFSAGGLRMRLKESMAQLWVYSGVRRAVGASSAVHGAYIGYYGMKPLFVAYSGEGVLKVKALAHGLVVKEKGKPAQDLGPKAVTEIPLGAGQHVTLRRRMHWWKFQLVGVPVRALEKISEKPQPTEEELKWSRSLGTVFFLLLACLVGVRLFGNVQPTPLPQPQEVKVLPRKARESVATGKAAPAAQPAAASTDAATAPSPQNDAQANGAHEENASSPAAAALQPMAAALPHPKLSDAQKAHREATRSADLLRKALLSSRLTAPDPQAAPVVSAENGLARRLMAADSATSAPDAGTPMALEVSPVAPVEKLGAHGLFHAKVRYDADESLNAWLSGSRKSLTSVTGSGDASEEGLSRDEVAAVIRAHMSEVRYCHEAALVRNPKLAGRVVLHFVIAGSGEVKTAKEESGTVSDRDLAGCILRRLSAWRFPKPRGGASVNVSFPFLFKVLDDQ